MYDAPNDPLETLIDVIASEFSFLDECGFQATVESENSVKCEASNGVFVRVFRDPHDKYIGFRVGLASRPRDALTAAELARLTGAPPGDEYPERKSQLRSSVARVAHQLRTQGQRVLSGDETILDEAMALRREHTQPFTRQKPTGSPRGEAG